MSTPTRESELLNRSTDGSSPFAASPAQMAPRTPPPTIAPPTPVEPAMAVAPEEPPRHGVMAEMGKNIKGTFHNAGAAIKDTFQTLAGKGPHRSRDDGSAEGEFTEKAYKQHMRTGSDSGEVLDAGADVLYAPIARTELDPSAVELGRQRPIFTADMAAQHDLLASQQNFREHLRTGSDNGEVLYASGIMDAPIARTELNPKAVSMGRERSIVGGNAETQQDFREHLRTGSDNGEVLYASGIMSAPIARTELNPKAVSVGREASLSRGRPADLSNVETQQSFQEHLLSGSTSGEVINTASDILSAPLVHTDLGPGAVDVGSDRPLDDARIVSATQMSLGGQNYSKRWESETADCQSGACGEGYSGSQALGCSAAISGNAENFGALRETGAGSNFGGAHPSYHSRQAPVRQVPPRPAEPSSWTGMHYSQFVKDNREGGAYSENPDDGYPPIVRSSGLGGELPLYEQERRRADKSIVCSSGLGGEVVDDTCPSGVDGRLPAEQCSTTSTTSVLSEPVSQEQLDFLQQQQRFHELQQQELLDRSQELRQQQFEQQQREHFQQLQQKFEHQSHYPPVPHQPMTYATGQLPPPYNGRKMGVGMAQKHEMKDAAHTSKQADGRF